MYNTYKLKLIMVVASTLIGTMAGACRPGNCATAR